MSPQYAQGSSDSSGAPVSARRITLRDIAEAVGVTTMTVSRALRNQERIAEETRRKIHAKAAELGYHPDPVLAALVHYRQNRQAAPVRSAMAWLNRWPDPAQLRRYREFDLYWKGAKMAAERLGFHLEEFALKEPMTPARLTQILGTRDVRGLLLPPGPPFPAEWVKEFPWSQFSAVSLGRANDGLTIHSVTADQTRNAMLCLEKLGERGYQRIGFVGESWIGRNFAAGYLWKQALEVQPELRIPPFLFNWQEWTEIQAQFERWLKAYKPDAILSDLPQLPELVAKAGLRVPEDIGLAALTVLDCPVDAGIYQNAEEIGRVGVLMLHSLINDNDRGIPPIERQVLIRGKWVDGAMLPPRL